MFYLVGLSQDNIVVLNQTESQLILGVNIMKNNYQVCLECCHKFKMPFNDFITSRCHRKFCDLCGYSSNNDLAMLSKNRVDKKLKLYKILGRIE